MYTPEIFAEHDRKQIASLIRSVGLATLVTYSADGLMATPLPLVFAEDEAEHGVLHGHIARANPQWQQDAVGDALVIFQGPDAYVHPGWYPTKAEHGRVVPTWNYVAVHAYGAVEFYDDPNRLLEGLSALTKRFEAGRQDQWSVQDAPRDYIEAQLRGIIGVRIPIRRIDAKQKLSQNQPSRNRAGVKAGLSASSRHKDRIIAEKISQEL
ncbi:FMN-binding negative transcriptional regulator [Terriglobus albidus]|uniref:FMN-binding negative transcriptional regulator n=1 Tax=Terriglobus albidus TaxID=1592106 RepID=A0A5B9EJI2_9BACT|nr:FMN-binding negative transcriptional regulator [Terriglobus albidus]QEE30557.1 FMN-binding negative transcriptional regulator [Terriglobus albidus]